MIDLDYVNGWDKTPEIVIECQKLNHKLDHKTVGNCLHQTICKECNYKYLTDTSG